MKDAAARETESRTPPRPLINPARIDLVSLQLVLECAARGSISAAARHSHLSVMGASERLRRLENALGKPLFHRHRSGLALTEAGAVVTRAATTILLVVNGLVHDVAAAQSSPPPMRPNTGRAGNAGTRDSQPVDQLH